MKRNLVLALAFILAFTLTGCGGEPAEPASAPAPLTETAEPSAPEETVPDGLPDTLASEEDLTGEGGYLLLGEIPEEDIALYCDNLEERNQVYLRYGEHFQSFEQPVWSDPTVLPELSWEDWDEDGQMDLCVKYLRHEGVYFDGEKNTPGLVHEFVVYQWKDGQWIDLHFTSGGPAIFLEG